MNFPTLLDFPAPRVRAYPVETVVAEKLQALVALGPKNSRMKDFFDLDYLTKAFEFDSKLLCQSIRGTFERRKTLIPPTIPLGLTREFAVEKQTLWAAFLSRSEQVGEAEFVKLVERLQTFLLPLLQALFTGDAFEKRWPKGGTWIDT